MLDVRIRREESMLSPEWKHEVVTERIKQLE